MPTLKISSNSAANPQTLDLSPYLRLQPDQGTDPAGPAFTQRVFARSLLKEGATLALEQNVEREWTFPVAFKGTSQSVVNSTLVQQANQILETPGATMSWQDDGMSQPTVADILSGQVQIEYDYYRGRASWCNAKILIFTTPFGHPPAPRPYAAASGYGPLLMISPYASSGAQAIGASTQAGVAGFGGAQQGASSGVFYWGSPSLAGDAPASLQVSYAGQAVASQTLAVAVSLLPDRNYNPLCTMNQIAGGGRPYQAQNAVASAYQTVAGGSSASFGVNNAPAFVAPVSWAGLHRVLVIARASSAGTPSASLSTGGTGITGAAAITTAAVTVPTWQLYDVGTITMRASEAPGTETTVLAQAPAGTALDVTAVLQVPDNSTWFLKGPSQTSNVILLDDYVGDQFLQNFSQPTSPSPAAMALGVTRFTQYSRGIVPRPDPKNGLPILAIIGVPVAASSNGLAAPTYAQVNVLERVRYILP